MRLKRFTTVVLIVFSFTSFFEVHGQESSPKTENKIKKKKHRKRKIRLPEIDLSNWSVTVPAERAEGKPVSRYMSSRDKKQQPDRIEKKKYNKFLRRHTLHREIKG